MAKIKQKIKVTKTTKAAKKSKDIPISYAVCGQSSPELNSNLVGRIIER